MRSNYFGPLFLKLYLNEYYLFPVFTFHTRKNSVYYAMLSWITINYRKVDQTVSFPNFSGFYKSVRKRQELCAAGVPRRDSVTKELDNILA